MPSRSLYDVRLQRIAEQANDAIYEKHHHAVPSKPFLEDLLFQLDGIQTLAQKAMPHDRT